MTNDQQIPSDRPSRQNITQSSSGGANRPLKLLLVDNDPIFRLGLAVALAEYTDLQIVEQTEPNSALQLPKQSLDLIVLDPGWESYTGLRLCQQLQNKYPEIPIFLLSSQKDPQILRQAKEMRIGGYCPKGTAIAELVAIFRRVARGETYWSILASLPQKKPFQFSLSRPKKWLEQTRRSGIEQIDTSLAAVNRQVENSELPLLDWLFWSGRKRELLLARRIVSQLLPTAETIASVPSESLQKLVSGSASVPVSINSGSSSFLARFNNTLPKIQSGGKNLTGIAFETDILRGQKQQELYYLILNQIEKSLAELQFLEATVEQLPERTNSILRDLWQSATINFLGKNYSSLNQNEYFDLVEILLRDAVTVQSEILAKIPLIPELFAYYLFEQPLLIEGVLYRPEAPETKAKAELILENLLIQTANGVMQVILNNFSEAEEIKQNLYINRFLSSREIAKFRNELSWRYRQEKYWQEPKYIFESQYRLFFFNQLGIKKIFIYAPRQAELEQLKGIRWAVSVALESRDAIAPRLQSLVDFLGRGVVYVLTEVIGKGIGLVGRGVILGVGNVLQETRYRKNSERGKQ